MPVELAVVSSIRELVTSSDQTLTRQDHSDELRVSTLLVVRFQLNTTPADMLSPRYIKEGSMKPEKSDTKLSSQLLHSSTL